MKPFAPAKGRFAAKKRMKRAKRQEAPKPCRFTKEGTFEIDYRDLDSIGKLTSAQGKVAARKRNGVSAFYQRQATLAIKRARFLALLPFLGD